MKLKWPRINEERSQGLFKGTKEERSQGLIKGTKDVMNLKQKSMRE